MTRKPRPLAAVPSIDRAPPYSAEAEQALIGVLLVMPERLPEVATLVRQADFYLDSHRRIWRHVTEMHAAGEHIDALTVADRIAQFNEDDQTGGLAYVGGLAGSSQPSANVAAYARLISDRANRRLLLARLADIDQLARSAGSGSASERIAAATKMLADLSGEVVAEVSDASLLDVTPAAVLDSSQTFTDELVEDVLTKHGVSVVYGASNSGKTFFAIDLAASVARGTMWNGKNTRRAGVLYLATESPSSVRNRISAYMAHHDIDMLDVFVAAKPINLFESDADVDRVVTEISYIRQTFDCEIGLIIGDTMARIAAGANENAGEDMGVVMANADKLCRATSCAFMWIHHSGKDEAKGARGWSGIRAHIDTEIEIKDADDDGVHSAEITKQRDLAGKGTRYGFRLAVHRLGLNQWGNVRTTCVVIPDIAPERSKGGRPDIAGPAILLYLEQKGNGARMREIVDALDGKLSRSKVYEGVKRLSESGRVSIVAGIVGLNR